MSTFGFMMFIGNSLEHFLVGGRYGMHGSASKLKSQGSTSAETNIGCGESRKGRGGLLEAALRWLRWGLRCR